VVLSPRKAADPTSFVGHHGYRFRLTPRTTAENLVTSAFRDETKTSEVVFVHPRAMTGEEVFRTPESSYTARGILRLEVNPNSAYPDKVQPRLLEAFRFAAESTLRERGQPFSVQELEGAPLPGFALEIGGPAPVTQVFLKGRSFHYLLTGDRRMMALHEILSSLEDAPR